MREKDRLVKRIHVVLKELKMITTENLNRLRDMVDDCDGETKEIERYEMVEFKNKCIDKNVEVLNSVVVLCKL